MVLSIPVAFGIHWNLYPALELPEKLRILCIGTALFGSFLPHLLTLGLMLRNPRASLAVYLLGTLLRLFLLGLLTLLLFPKPELLRPGLILFLIFTGSFLFFEVASLPLLPLYRRPPPPADGKIDAIR